MYVCLHASIYGEPMFNLQLSHLVRAYFSVCPFLYYCKYNICDADEIVFMRGACVCECTRIRFSSQSNIIWIFSLLHAYPPCTVYRHIVYTHVHRHACAHREKELSCLA